MSYRKGSGRKKPSRFTQVLPIWSQANTTAATMLIQDLLQRMGITDVPSYFHKLQLPIAISVVVCGGIGAASDGLQGLVIGALLGVGVPIALLGAVVLLVLITLYLALFAAVWVAIFAIAGGLLK